MPWSLLAILSKCKLRNVAHPHHQPPPRVLKSCNPGFRHAGPVLTTGRGLPLDLPNAMARRPLGGNLRGGLQQENIGFRLLKFLEPSAQKQGFANCIKLLSHSSTHGAPHNSAHFGIAVILHLLILCEVNQFLPPFLTDWVIVNNGLWWHPSWLFSLMDFVFWDEAKWGVRLTVLCILAVFTSLADFACWEGRDCNIAEPNCPALGKSLRMLGLMSTGKTAQTSLPKKY